MQIAPLQNQSAFDPATDRLTPADLAVVLALARGGSLARAAQTLAVDASTVFRNAHRLEKRLGQRLFERARTGWRPTDLGQSLAQHAERIEAELEAARGAARSGGDPVAGTVRLSTTDTLLQGLVLPALPALALAHPRLHFELHAGNEAVSLTRRDADIALRATRSPPPHLVGRALGTIRSAVYAARPAGGGALPPRPALADCPWIAPDDALPDHPSVQWRRRHLPRVVPRYRVHAIGAVFDAIRCGLGVGIVPCFLAARHDDVVPLTDALPECETSLWMLTHTESRHLRRIAAVTEYLARAVSLP